MEVFGKFSESADNSTDNKKDIALEINNLKGTDKALDAIRLRLDSLIKEKGAWYYLALELKGVILYKIAAYSESAETFLSLAQDKDTPNALKLRAQLMTQVLASKLNILKK